MADDQEQEQGQQGGGALTLEGVRQVIAESLGNLFDSGKADVVDKGSQAGAAPADISSQVRTEVEKIRAADVADAKAGDRIASIEAALAELKGRAEKAPTEFRKITKFLWGDQ